MSFSEGGRIVGSQGLHIGTGAPDDYVVISKAETSHWDPLT